MDAFETASCMHSMQTPPSRKIDNAGRRHTLTCTLSQTPSASAGPHISHAATQVIRTATWMIQYRAYRPCRSNRVTQYHPGICMIWPVAVLAQRAWPRQVHGSSMHTAGSYKVQESTLSLAHTCVSEVVIDSWGFVI